MNRLQKLVILIVTAVAEAGASSLGGCPEGHLYIS
jgi:hypothetical protein